MRSICYLVLVLLPLAYSAPSTCNSYYVRWPRVKLNFKAVTNARLNLKACQSACSLGEDPVVPGRKLECAAMNHHPSPDGFSHQCDVFQPHQLQNVDGYVEADDRYSFYWKYCLNSTRKCGADYAFTFLSDRFMDHNEVVRVVKMSSLEECLTECLEETSFPCRSISFNRTDGGCHLSANSQLTKPGSVKLNNNPNFRIDYYENNCYNMSESFKFEQECREDGVMVRVKSKFPYTGALYGLYDFFTCRIEPKEQNSFEYLFPSPTISKNCSDSIRFKGNEMVLEVVLSTDGVEPLYFITPDDLTYQAKCPIQPAMRKSSVAPIKPINEVTDTTKQMEASAHALFSMLAKETSLPKKETFQLPLTTPTASGANTRTTTTVVPPSSTTTKKPTTRAPTTTTSTTTTTTTTTPTTTTTTTTPKSTTQTTQVNFDIFETNELGEQKDVQPESISQPNLETNNGVLEISFGETTSTVKPKSSSFDPQPSSSTSTTILSTSTVAQIATETVPSTNSSTQVTTTVSPSSSEAPTSPSQSSTITSTNETKTDIEKIEVPSVPIVLSDELSSTTVNPTTSSTATTQTQSTAHSETAKPQETTTASIATQSPQFEPDGSVIQEIPTGSPEPVETFEENKEVMIINGVFMNATKEPLLATLASKATVAVSEVTTVASTSRSTASHSTASHSTTLHSATSHSTTPRNTTLRSTTLRSTTSHSSSVAARKEEIQTVKTELNTISNGVEKKSVSVSTSSASPSISTKGTTSPTETPVQQTSTVETPKKEAPAKGTLQPIQEHLRKMQLVENKARSIIEQEKKVTKPLLKLQKPIKKANRQTKKPATDIPPSSTVPSTTKAPLKSTKKKPAAQAKPQTKPANTKNRSSGKQLARQSKPAQTINHSPTNQTSTSRPPARSQRRKTVSTNPVATTTVSPSITWNPTLEHITKLLEKGMPIEEILKSDEINLKDLDVLRGIATTTTTSPTTSTTLAKFNRVIKKVQNRQIPKQRRSSAATPSHTTTTSSPPPTSSKRSLFNRQHSNSRRPIQRQQSRKSSPDATVPTTTTPTTSPTTTAPRRAIAVSKGVVHRREPSNSPNKTSILSIPIKEEKKLPLPRHPSNRGTNSKPKKQIKKESRLFARKSPKTAPALPIKDIEGDIMAMLLKLSHLIDNQPMILQKNQLDSNRNSKTMTNMKNNAHQLKRRTSTKATTTTSAPTTTTTVKTTTKAFHRAPAVHAPGPAASTNQKIVTAVKEPVSFDIYKDGRPVDGVVVGSKITFAFTPHYPIPADHMSIIGCQSEPVDPKYEWEKEVLPIIKDSCPVDFVGLVCPPSQSEYGLKVVVESFRYQTTPQVLYTCLIRICPFGVCPKKKCPDVEGCPNERHKRALSLEQIREALEKDPDLARQFGITADMLTNKPLSVEQQLMALGGDHVVQRRLVVVNSEDQLKYFVNTGDLP